MKIQDLKNKKIAILGYGLEWQSTLTFLQEQEITDITILDKNDLLQPLSLVLKDTPSDKKGDKVNCEAREDTLGWNVRESWKIQVKSILWENYLDSLAEFDIIIKSPGVSPFWEKLLPHREKFISQTQIFFENYTWNVIGITGTKGKSTISTLLYQCLLAAWKTVKLVWNIWSPVLHEIDIVWGEKYDYIVYEMSSYMLQDFCPKLHIWFINNIYPCHLDWHYHSMNIYKQAKLNILEHAEHKIVNSELQNDTEVLWVEGKKIFFNQIGKYQYQNENLYQDDTKILSDIEIALKWEHNMKNICGVASMLEIIFQEDTQVVKMLSEVLTDFWWLPHRIEKVWIYEWITFVDDAYASTPDSTLAAIRTFPTSLQTLFLWGQDSGFSTESLRQWILSSSIQNIIAFPDTSEKIFPEIVSRDYESAFEIEISGKILQFIKTRSMKQWVDFAYKTTFPWKVALLSCAAPSFSLWKNRDEKANEFIQEVQGY